MFRFDLSNGRPSPLFTADWEAALRGSRVEILLKPDQVLFRSLDFPKRAVEFLDGMIRAQIDRLTPWTANEAVFGWSPPADIAKRADSADPRGDVEKQNSAARSACGQFRRGVRYRVCRTAARRGRAGKIEGVRDVAAERDRAAGSMCRAILRITLLGTGLAAAASLLLAAYIGNMLDAEQQQLLRRIAERRASLRLSQAAGGGSALSLLAKRKQTTPSSVMVLEAISRVLPDSTYVTELRIEGDKVQVVGISQDAPSLIRLMEQSPQFSRATFFAPTTRAQSDPGERFHIEVHITPYFGSGT